MPFYQDPYAQSNPTTPQVFSWDISPSEHDTSPQPMTPIVTHYSTPEDQEVIEQFLQQQLEQQQQLSQLQPQPQLQPQQTRPQPQQRLEYQHPPTIQLPERSAYTAKYRFDNVTQEDFRQQQAEATQSDDRKAETSGSRRASSKPPLHISMTSRASVSPVASSSGAARSAAIGPSRHMRGTHGAHPYRRPHSAAAVRGAGHGTPRVSSDPITRLHPVHTEGREAEVATDTFPQTLVPAQATRQTFASSSTVGSRAAVSAMSVTCPAVSLWRNRVLRPSAMGSGEAGTRCVCPVAVLVAPARLLLACPYVARIHHHSRVATPSARIFSLTRWTTSSSPCSNSPV